MKYFKHILFTFILMAEYSATECFSNDAALPQSLQKQFPGNDPYPVMHSL